MYNDCHNILDFDDSDVLNTNNFETHSFKDYNNAGNMGYIVFISFIKLLISIVRNSHKLLRSN